MPQLKEIPVKDIVQRRDSLQFAMKRSGRTTRLIDNYIQSIFEAPMGTIHIIQDHNPANDIDLLRCILRRIENEHPYLIGNSAFALDVNYNTPSITVKYRDDKEEIRAQ